MNTVITITPMINTEWQQSLVAVKNAWLFAGTYDLVKMAESLRCGLKPRTAEAMPKRTIAYIVRVDLIFPSMHIRRTLSPKEVTVDGRLLVLAGRPPFKVRSSLVMTEWEGCILEEHYCSHLCRVTPVFPNDPTTVLDRKLHCWYEGIFPSYLTEEEITESIGYEDGDI